jgi:hypothetical protein
MKAKTEYYPQRLLGCVAAFALIDPLRGSIAAALVVTW